MNNQYISLSSNSVSSVETLSEIELDDLTTINLNLSGINERFIPLYMTIDWGDEDQETFDNSIFKTYRSDSIFPEILYGKFSSLLSETYSHIYYPSDTTLYNKLTAQVYIDYSNGDYTWIKIPLKIRNRDYFESIYDIDLINTNILPSTSNKKQHQFIIDEGGFLIEIE